MDADRPGPHYTADMVRLLQLQTGNAADLFFLMGMDSLGATCPPGTRPIGSCATARSSPSPATM